MFRVIIAGSRGFTDYKLLRETCDKLLSKYSDVTIISGAARGADTLGERYAKEHNIPLIVYPADWSTGRNAGFRRNKEMAENADALIAFYDGSSKGTRHMIATAMKRKLYVRVVHYLEGVVSGNDLEVLEDF